MSDRQLEMLHELTAQSLKIDIEDANTGERATTDQNVKTVASPARFGTTGTIDGVGVVRLDPINLLPPTSIDRSSIIVADDDPMMCDCLQQLLSPAYQVETVANGVAAIAAIDRQPPDLVLADVMMPNLDGLELLRSIRANPATQDLPVILISGYTDEASRIAGLEAGADDYIVKPFSANELVARVDATLKLARLRRSGRDRERALQQETDTARANLDRIVANINNGFATVDRQWRYTYVNNRLLEIFELPREAVLGRQAWEVFPSQVGVEFFDLLSQAMTDRVEAQFEYYYHQIECWVEHRVYPIDDGLAILMADVTERKHAQESVRQSEERLRGVLDGMGEGFALLAPDFTILEHNREALRLDGRPREEIVGGSHWEVFPGSETSELGRLLKQAMAERVSVSLEHLYAWEENRALWLEMRAYPTDDGLLAVFWRDVTDRRKVQESLRESEANYRTLFDSIDEGFCIVEMLFDAQDRPVDYRFIQANPAFIGLTGFPADALGKRVRELVPDLEEFWFETYGKVALTGEGVRFENYSAPMNRWFDVYATRVGDVASRRVAIVFDNITERKQLEKISQLAAKLDAFRIALADALRPLANPVEIQATASRILGEYLGANRVVYFEIRGTDYVVERDYVNGVMPLSGSYPIDSFSPKVLAAHRAGRTVAVFDLAADSDLSPEQQAAYAAIGNAALIDVPLVKNGEFIAGLAVHVSQPREWTPDEITLCEEVAERTLAAIERARAEAAVAANLRDTQLLRELGAQLVSEDDIDTLYREILATAIALTGADAGTMQMLDENTQDLCFLASQNIEPAIIEHFARVNVSSDTSCGRALRQGTRIFVDFDAPDSPDPDGSMRLHLEAGLLCAQSTPLISRTGKPIGMVSTHWRTRHQPSVRESQLLDLLARQATDLIEQRQTTLALRDREAQLRLATEASKLGMWFWNLESDTLTWTEQCKAIFGLPADAEMSYEIFLAALHPDDRQPTQDAVTRSIVERIDYDIEFRTCWPDGTVRWAASKGSCTYDPAGTPIQMLGVALDITDRKRAEEALAERARQLADLNSRLAQSEIQLQERNQELNSFVHIVSHDLKAPLRAVSNLSVWIEEDLEGTVSANTTEQIHLLRGRVQRMEGMIDGLLEYARLGRQDSQLELVSVADLVTEVIESIAPPPTFSISIAAELPTLAANRLLLSQVFANLISNAFKHHNRSDGSIRISSRELGELYEFAVTDDGPGIAPEYRDRVFVIFQSANAQKHPDSTGIGLSIVKKIVETAGGRIWLESELGRGTTFYFTWPRDYDSIGG